MLLIEPLRKKAFVLFVENQVIMRLNVGNVL